MARQASAGRGGGGMTIAIQVDDSAVLAGLRAQRRAISQDVKRTTLSAAEATVVPSARALTAPTRAKRSIIARSTTRGAYLTTNLRGSEKATVGLLNFGGTVTTPIRPKRGRALKFGPNLFAAVITTPRRYRGKDFLGRAVEANVGRFSEHVERELTQLMQSRITYAATFA